MAGKGRPGPASSGRVAQSVRWAHHGVYAEQARQLGMSFTAYVNLVLAQAHGLPAPGDREPHLELQLNPVPGPRLEHRQLTLAPAPAGPASSEIVAQTVRWAHHGVYAEQARQLGMSFTAYVNLVLAQAHGLPAPTARKARGERQLTLGSEPYASVDEHEMGVAS